MWHTLFVILHAGTATLALLAGLVALRAGRAFEVYRWSLVGMTAFLVPALVAGWGGFATAARVVFLALLGLAAVMVHRAVAAGRLLPRDTGGPTGPYLDHVGFTLISLTDGFAVVAVLRAGAPAWLIAVIGIGIAVAGHVALESAKRRLARPPAVAAVMMRRPAASRQ
ncbi:hypothetical protein OF117_16020 [Geodermatophilus sp. YIM 151500]|uniref:hypothetical protein n=1 Tax=Geodermatophilus sp. YIM 151500 TaxID=2984531 RepID=UPI0021E3E83E|nr:hypothetical protein [Geodermatophilus sp. YIM 151500]MCV2490863.1 hypothetical protein [Geodermatophilus sp. YIM 151500]